MKCFESGEHLANEMGIETEVLQKTFDAYNEATRTKNDPFGKKVSCICLAYIPHFNICDSSLRPESGR